MSNRQLVKIVPPAPTGSGLVLTQGTQVFVGDTEITNITKIVLTAEVNDIWRAEIHCHVAIQSMEALAIINPKCAGWFKRWLNQMVGLSADKQ